MRAPRAAASRAENAIFWRAPTSTGPCGDPILGSRETPAAQSEPKTEATPWYVCNGGSLEQITRGLSDAGREAVMARPVPDACRPENRPGDPHRDHRDS